MIGRMGVERRKKKVEIKDASGGYKVVSLEKALHSRTRFCIHSHVHIYIYICIYVYIYTLTHSRTRFTQKSHTYSEK